MPRRKLAARRTAREVWDAMSTLKRLVLAAGAVSAALVAVYGAWGKATESVDIYRPWASRATEVIVAGWQSDRLANDLRDIRSRIDRLEAKRKLAPKTFSADDAAELNYWYSQQREREMLFKQVEIERRPVAQQRQ